MNLVLVGVEKNIKSVVGQTNLYNYTVLEKIDELNPRNNLVALKKAANILKNNGLVAFPTETVYGLGANALEETAIKKIYIAKGRPSDNPLIVHISSIEEIYPLIDLMPEKALFLAKKFWPGPLTIVLKKSDLIPSITSGGLNTVAIRIPKNNIARALIKECKFPIAAPSANISTKPSPTMACHVYSDLNGKIDMIIDGGPCHFGIESTVIEVLEDKVTILRPGSITKEMLESIVSNVEIDKPILEENLTTLPRSPGMKYKHYAPKGDIFIIDGNTNNVKNYILSSLKNDKIYNINSIAIISAEMMPFYKNFNTLNIGSIKNQQSIAKNIFLVLRKCDSLNMEKIYIEAFSEKGIGLAIMNRLKKASGYNIIKL